MRRRVTQRSRCWHGSADRGVSLILVMLSMLVLSVLAATIVFTARSETLASYNFKLDTQADYLAKAGIQQAVNWFRSANYKGVDPTIAPTYYNVADSGAPYHLYTSTTEPVTCKANCDHTGTGSSANVQLMGIPGTGSSNYPSINNAAGAAVTTQFTSDLLGQPVVGDANNQGTFSISAVLLNYQTVNTGQAPLLTANAVETWLITSRASWTGGSSGVVATAEEQAIVQPIYNPTWGNALFGYCSVEMQGSSGVCTDAYNSAVGCYGDPSACSNKTAAGNCGTSLSNVIDSGAGVGANGFVSLGSNVVVDGNVSIGTNPTGGSACCTGSGCGFQGSSSSVAGQVVNGPNVSPPQFLPPKPWPTGSTDGWPVNFPTGVPPVSLGNSQVATYPQNAGTGYPWPTTFPSGPIPGTGTSGFPQPCLTGGTCDGTATNPYTLNVTDMKTGSKLQLMGGPDIYHPIYYDFDTLNFNNGDINVSGYVVINVKTTLDLGGQSVINPVSSTNSSPELIQINFTGTSLAVHGNGALCAIIQAPNADVVFGGGGSGGYMVGAVQGKTLSFKGGYPIHYDIQLNRTGGTLAVMTTTGYTRRRM